MKKFIFTIILILTLSGWWAIGAVSYTPYDPTAIHDAVTSANITDGTIVTVDLADSNITSIKIKDGEVKTSDIADSNITTGKILDGTITADDISTGGVGTAEILDGTIAAIDVATSAITTIKIADSNITTGKILDGTIASADMAKSVLKVDTITVTSPEILTLYSVPIMLVATPLADEVIQFLGATVFYNYSGAAYSDCAQNMLIKYANITGATASGSLSGTGFLDQTNDRTATMIPIAVAAATPAAIESQPIVFGMETQNPNDGVGNDATGTLSITVSYRVITTP